MAGRTTAGVAGQVPEVPEVGNRVLARALVDNLALRENEEVVELGDLQFPSTTDTTTRKGFNAYLDECGRDPTVKAAQKL